jgi:hypothetical protein
VALHHQGERQRATQAKWGSLSSSSSFFVNLYIYMEAPPPNTFTEFGDINTLTLYKGDVPYKFLDASIFIFKST